MDMHISAEGKIGIGLTLIFALGAGAYMRYPDQTWIGTLTMIIAALGLALLFAHHLWTRPKKDKRHSSPVTQSRSVLSEDGSTLLDPGYLIDQCKGKTNFQINALLAPYLGKVLTISGQIMNISDVDYGGNRLELWVDIDCSDKVKIQARFNANDKTTLTQLSKGATVTAQGKVAEFIFSRLIINDCKLLQIART